MHPTSARARRFPRSTSLALLLLVGASLAPALVRAASVTLPDDTWQLVVVPGDTAGRSVAELFGSSLPMSDYTSTWTLFVLDGGGAGYTEPAPGATIPTGSAFWLIQRTGGDVVVDLPVAPPEALLLPGCLSSAGCVSLPLETRANDVAWSAVGVPFERDTPLADLRVMTPSGACVDGCDLGEAAAEDLTAGTLWSQLDASGSYRELGTTDTLVPWQGFWIPIRTGATLIGAVELLVPLGELDLQYCA